MKSATVVGLRKSDILLGVLGIAVLSICGFNLHLVHEHHFENHHSSKRFPDAGSTTKKVSPRKPRIIIHVGPSKTGTTTIQKTLAALPNELDQDGYVYVGRYSKSPTRAAKVKDLLRGSCIRDHLGATGTSSSRNATTCWDDLKNSLAELYKEGTSIILSDEGYSYKTMWDPNKGPYSVPGYWEEMEETLRDWSVTIVVGYRRYSEWLLSTWKESVSKMVLENKSPWFHQGGRPPPLVWDRITYWRSLGSGRGGTYVYGDVSVAMWSQHFPVEIINLHHPRHSILHQFVCDVLASNEQQRPSSCCRKVQAQEARAWTHLNPSRSPLATWATIAYEAAKLAHQTRNASLGPDLLRERTNVTLQLEANCNSKWSEIPYWQQHNALICPSWKELLDLRNASWAQEQGLLASNVAMGESIHHDAFDRHLKAKEFCSMNVTHLFQNNRTWEQLVTLLGCKLPL